MKTFIYSLMMLALLGSVHLSALAADDVTIEDVRKSYTKKVKNVEEKIKELEKEIEKKRDETEEKLAKIEDFTNGTDEYKKNNVPNLPDKDKLDDDDKIEEYREKLEEQQDEISAIDCGSDASCSTSQTASKNAIEAAIKIMADADPDDLKKNLMGQYQLLAKKQKKLKKLKSFKKILAKAEDTEDKIKELEREVEFQQDISCSYQEQSEGNADLAYAAMGNVSSLSQNINMAMQAMSHQSANMNQALALNSQMLDHTRNMYNWNWFTPYPHFNPQFNPYAYGPGHNSWFPYGQHNVYQPGGMTQQYINQGQNINFFPPAMPQIERFDHEDLSYSEMIWNS